MISLAFHLLLRWRASYADPLLLPIVTLLNGLGLVMIHRLDIAKGNSVSEGLALKQLTWSALAVAIAGAVLFFLRDHRALRRYTFTAAAVGFGLLILPLVPGLGRQVYGSRSGSAWGRSRSSRERSPRSCSPSSSPATWCRPATSCPSPAARSSASPCPARDLGPILVAWAASLGVLVFEKDLGSSLLFFGLFVAMLYVATERRSWIAIGLVLFSLAPTWPTCSSGTCSSASCSGSTRSPRRPWPSPTSSPADSWAWRTVGSWEPDLAAAGPT